MFPNYKFILVKIYVGNVLERLQKGKKIFSDIGDKMVDRQREYKGILTRQKKSEHWFNYDYNMNLYRGCSHGCIYCDSRSQCYGIINFDEIEVKTNAIEILERELKKKRKSVIIGIGAMSDPYNPREGKEALTRRSLELILKYQHGIVITTKSDLIIRDIDIIVEINKSQPVLCVFSINTTDDKLAAKTEPNVAKPSVRFNAIRELTHKGINTGALLMPVLPFITDSNENIKNIIEASHKAGVKFIYPSFGVTLRGNQRNYFYEKLDLNFPGLSEIYKKTFSENYYCESLKSKELRRTFIETCEKYGIHYQMKEINYRYLESQTNQQLSILDME